MTRAEKAVLWRWALIGAAICGALGFFGGIALCLTYKLPIPPLFTSELGMVIGGCLGASLRWFHLRQIWSESGGDSEQW
jgi:hypothetical protein